MQFVANCRKLTQNQFCEFPKFAILRFRKIEKSDFRKLSQLLATHKDPPSRRQGRACTMQGGSRADARGRGWMSDYKPGCIQVPASFFPEQSLQVEATTFSARCWKGAVRQIRCLGTFGGYAKRKYSRHLMKHLRGANTFRPPPRAKLQYWLSPRANAQATKITCLVRNIFVRHVIHT